VREDGRIDHGFIVLELAGELGEPPGDHGRSVHFG
jgi:hypothetical protein